MHARQEDTVTALYERRDTQSEVLQSLQRKELDIQPRLDNLKRYLHNSRTSCRSGTDQEVVAMWIKISQAIGEISAASIGILSFSNEKSEKHLEARGSNEKAAEEAGKGA